MKIDKSEFRVRPGFLLFLFVVFILCPWIASILLPANNGKKKAQIYFTRFETKEIATALNQHSVKIGGLTNIDDNFVIQTVFGTDGTINVNYHPTRTNSQGQVLDCWKRHIKSKFCREQILLFVPLAPIKNLATRTTSFSTAFQTIL